MGQESNLCKSRSTQLLHLGTRLFVLAAVQPHQRHLALFPVFINIQYKHYVYVRMNLINLYACEYFESSVKFFI